VGFYQSSGVFGQMPSVLTVAVVYMQFMLSPIDFVFQLLGQVVVGNSLKIIGIVIVPAIIFVVECRYPQVSDTVA
jgi:hypothetical protein